MPNMTVKERTVLLMCEQLLTVPEGIVSDLIVNIYIYTNTLFSNKRYKI